MSLPRALELRTRRRLRMPDSRLALPSLNDSRRRTDRRLCGRPETSRYPTDSVQCPCRRRSHVDVHDEME
jgi:hypothetical protein